jgi:bifunctional non-homologous end joining protein LigD
VQINSKTPARSSVTKSQQGLTAKFIEPMLLLRTESLPSGEQWLYELKLDGYRAIAFKRSGTVHLRSRNDNDFNARYPAVVEALTKLPDNTVIDGEVVAFDQEGRPFLEWTADNHLRHSKFVALREDKKARDVARE